MSRPSFSSSVSPGVFRVAVAIVFAGLALSARAELWEGTLGKSAIVVDIDPAEASLNGRYFYRRHRHPIDLSGQRAATGVVTLEEWSMGAEIPSNWRLDPASGDTLSGEWRGGGKRLPIRLRRLDAAALPATDDPGLAELRDTDPFRFLQLQGLALESNSVEAVDGYRVQWWREPASDVALFRVVSGYPDAQLPALNLALAREQWRAVAEQLDCTAYPQGEYTFSATLEYIGRDALSLSMTSGYYCGGAHPDFDQVGLNLDPRTGRPLALEDVLWLGDGPPPPATAHAGDVADEAAQRYRGDVLAPWLSERFQALYPERVRESFDEAGIPQDPDAEFNGCDYTDPSVWSLGDWRITRAGLRFGAYFPRVMRVCDDPDWAVLPWREVRAHPGRLKIAP